MAVFEKVKGFLGFDPEEDFEEDDFVEEEEHNYEPVTRTTQQPVQTSTPNSNNSKLVSIHAASDAKVVITRPTKYDDSVDICTALRNRNIVIINTSALETKVARRLLDFVSGAAYALDGNLDDIETRVYVVSPSNVQVTNELKTELSSKGMFNWK
ncbi:cell division protein SepF [uncultured Clostridium sp.]|jgi:cell division inhibitor SepF|uniref:cell division protein SepF n=1 Tax=uncultured Clostridium sp. TaxID=59620 RepID=UPI0026196E79|nr:cell division protein SepF [uncultured Clostridium sp.]